MRTRGVPGCGPGLQRDGAGLGSLPGLGSAPDCTMLDVEDIAHLIQTGRPLRRWRRTREIKVTAEVGEALIAAGMARRSTDG